MKVALGLERIVKAEKKYVYERKGGRKARLNWAVIENLSSRQFKLGFDLNVTFFFYFMLVQARVHAGISWGRFSHQFSRIKFSFRSFYFVNIIFMSHCVTLKIYPKGTKKRGNTFFTGYDFFFQFFFLIYSQKLILII